MIMMIFGRYYTIHVKLNNNNNNFSYKPTVISINHISVVHYYSFLLHLLFSIINFILFLFINCKLSKYHSELNFQVKKKNTEEVKLYEQQHYFKYDHETQTKNEFMSKNNNNNISSFPLPLKTF